VTQSDPKSKFLNITLLGFYKLFLSGDKFPVLRNHAQQMTNLFESTYLCEQYFSDMNIEMKAFRNQFDDEKL
jgi:hypothetical protein